MTTKHISHPPHQLSTLCVIENCLFALGGKDSDNQPFSTVYQYDPEMDTWKPAGDMTGSRYGVTTAVFKREEVSLSSLFVVGGYLGESNNIKVSCRITDCCEISVQGDSNGIPGIEY